MLPESDSASVYSGVRGAILGATALLAVGWRKPFVKVVPRSPLIILD